MVKLTQYLLVRSVNPPFSEQTLSVVTPTNAPSDNTAISQTVSEVSYEIGAEATATGPVTYAITLEGSLKCTTTAGNVTVNLPTVVGITGKVYCITNTTGANNVIINAFAGQTINGAASFTLVGSDNKWVTIISDGVSDWVTSTTQNISTLASQVSGTALVGSGVTPLNQIMAGTAQLRGINASSSRFSVAANTGTSNLDMDVKTNDSGTTSDDLWSASKIISYTGSNFQKEIYIIRDVKALGTNGGTSTTNTWIQRNLNNFQSNGGSNCTLGTNQFTLQPGTWQINALAPAVRTHQCRLFNVTSATTLLVGNTSLSPTTSVANSVINGIFTIASASVFQIQHITNPGTANTGFGTAGGFAGSLGEVYTQVVLTKLA